MAAYKGNEGKCYGNWDMRDPTCSRCLSFVREKCETVTRRKMAESSPDALAEKAMTLAQKRNDVNEYLFGMLDSKLERPTVHFGKPISTYCYYGSEPEREMVLFVAWNRTTGQIKVKSSMGAKVKKVVSLESTEQAEELARELLG